MIEVFNAGLLKLSDHERGITLRAYLANKLECDPMRITKKYTGASCLGKRVYHFDYQNADHAEAERARQELQILENNFRVKLDQMKRSRSEGHNHHVEETYRISTPAIDALLNRSKVTLPAMSFDHSFQAPLYSAYNPALSQYYTVPQSAGSYGQILKEAAEAQSTAEVSESVKLPQGPSAALMEPILMDAPTAMEFYRGPNGELYFPQHYPSLMAPQYFMAIAPPTNPYSDASSLLSQEYSMNCLPQNGAELRTFPQFTAATSLSSTKAIQLPTLSAVIPRTDSDIIHSSASLKEPPSTLSSDFLSGMNNFHNVTDTGVKKVKRNFSAAKLQSNQEFSNKMPNNAISESVEESEAASSLLGFINHLHRNSSQEDLAEFFENVQKCVQQRSPSSSNMPDLVSTMRRNASSSNLGIKVQAK